MLGQFQGRGSPEGETTEGLLVPSSLEEADIRSELTLKFQSEILYYHSMQILMNQLKILNCEEDTFKIMITAGGLLVALALLIVVLVLLQTFTSGESGVIVEKIGINIRSPATVVIRDFSI